MKIINRSPFAVSLTVHVKGEPHEIELGRPGALAKWNALAPADQIGEAPAPHEVEIGGKDVLAAFKADPGVRAWQDARIVEVC